MVEEVNGRAIFHYKQSMP